ncbi:methyltransferase domain-containing protein [Candidatus Woesebacteria bacterium]|nr:methyltransferase domain-containing protein [Candidatus Woesebacteria bacterium]
MQLLETFYDTYHKKNAAYKSSIQEGNFTYYYLAPLIRRISQGISKPAVLDVGCGVGTLSIFVAQYAQYVVGLDVSDRAIEIAEQAQRSLSLKNIFFKKKELTHAIGAFDLILCCEVLEHIADENYFLQVLYNNLKSGGVVILSSPLSETVLAGTTLYKNFDTEVGHLRRYTSLELNQKIEDAGFVVLKIYKTESLLRNLLFILHLDLLIKCIRGPLIPAFHWIDEKLCIVFGASNCIVVAQKK